MKTCWQKTIAGLLLLFCLVVFWFLLHVTLDSIRVEEAEEIGVDELLLPEFYDEKAPDDTYQERIE